MGKHIGFVSTRFAGTDGVSLEASKWANVLEHYGHRIFWFAGELDKKDEVSFLVKEAHFQHPQNKWINERIFGKRGRDPKVTDVIHAMRSHLKIKLHEFLKRFQLDMLVVENALTIPMHVPLGLALTELIGETQIPSIAHHHDFYWERDRFLVNCVAGYLQMAFPPNHHSLEHVVINSAAREQLAHRTGIAATIIPNVFDFENPPPSHPESSKDFKASIGLQPDDVLILQPTRIVQRKGIENSIQLIKALKNQRYKLVISHAPGDEGCEYADWLQETAKEQGVDLRLLKTCNTEQLSSDHQPSEEYSLWDIYPHADFVTYPSLYEGFGNAFVEAIFFRKPIIINRYSIFIRDIEPLGFDLVSMDGVITRRTVDQVREILESEERKQKMVQTNFDIAARHFSYAVLRKQLNSLIINVFGM